MKNFIWKVREFGLKVALDDVLISFTKWFLGAKRLQITYKNNMKKNKCNHPIGYCKNGYDICGICGKKVGGNGNKKTEKSKLN